MKRLIRKAEIKSFYHGSPLPRALEILNSSAINSMNTQGDGARQEQNVSLQADSVFVAADKQGAKPYATSHSKGWGIIFEMNLDASNVLIDEDTFSWGEGLDSTENRETFNKMFNRDAQKASDFVKGLVDSGFFEDKEGYDPYDDEMFDIIQEDFVGIDENGRYYMDLSGLQFANPGIANEILKMIPHEDQLKANNTTFAYAGDIPLSEVTTFYLVSNNEEFSFSNPEELKAKYEEINGTTNENNQ